MQAGWSNQFTPCIANPAGPGAMGFHYVNNALVDGQLDVAAPEALIYEPTDNGRMRLVAVEYIVPFSVVPATGTPPTLYGLNFAPSARFQVWRLGRVGVEAQLQRHARALQSRRVLPVALRVESTARGGAGAPPPPLTRVGVPGDVRTR